MKTLWVVFLLLVSVFVLSRTHQLTQLPVFADEAIYIRWAQLMRQDFDRWKYYPIQDGKPPLQMMLLAGTLGITEDPLLAARLTLAGIGLVTMIVIMLLTRNLGGGVLAMVAAGWIYTVLPYTLFHDRMALIDGLLTLFLSMTFFGLVGIIREQRWWWVVVGGVSYGLALWTKTPALLFLPIFGLVGLVSSVALKSSRWKVLAYFAAAGVLGMAIFLLMKDAEVFPALFNRSNDFTYSVKDVLRGEFEHVFGNTIKIGRWLITYLTLGVVVGVGLSIWFFRGLKQYLLHPLFLYGCGLLFVIPFVVFGNVLASRYFLPVVVFVIPAMSLTMEYLWHHRHRILLGVLAASILLQSVWFGGWLMLDPSRAPFAREDVEQYLTEWSAGYGIPEVRQFVIESAQSGRIAVATEGYFGTLPDGLLMYFDQSPLIDGIEIFGIGQPVRSIPEKVMSLSRTTPTYLVVNEHRYQPSDPSCCEVVAFYERPRGGPALLLLRVGTNE